MSTLALLIAFAYAATTRAACDEDGTFPKDYHSSVFQYAWLLPSSAIFLEICTICAHYLPPTIFLWKLITFSPHFRFHQGDNTYVASCGYFSKETDARILAGLRNLTGVSGPVKGSLSAEYLLTSRGLYLADIIHNGKTINGRIELLKGRCG